MQDAAILKACDAMLMLTRTMLMRSWSLRGEPSGNVLAKGIKCVSVINMLMPKSKSHMLATKLASK